MLLQNNGSESLEIEADGTFTSLITLPDNAPYEVTLLTQPIDPLQTCSIVDGTGVIQRADVSDIEVECTTQVFPVGGTVSGLSGSGLVLQNNGEDDLSIAQNGLFVFDTEIPDGEPFDVTVMSQPTGLDQTCSVSNGTGTIDASDALDIEVDCVTDTFTMGGQVSDLSGSGLALGLVGNDALAIAADGLFECPSALPDGTAYEVVVVSQPANPLQLCSVSDGVGVISGGNVGDALVECVDRGNMIFSDRYEN
ncbi:MAG: hypothetical protein ACXIUL_12290 [Wenzhouxiangella sp.]